MKNTLQNNDLAITTHASQRLEERLKCNKGKIKKIVTKAWNSKGDTMRERDTSRLIKHEEHSDRIIFKYYLGYIFIFTTKYSVKYEKDQKVLITLFNPRVYNSRKLSTGDDIKTEEKIINKFFEINKEQKSQ